MELYYPACLILFVRVDVFIDLVVFDVSFVPPSSSEFCSSLRFSAGLPMEHFLGDGAHVGDGRIQQVWRQLHPSSTQWLLGKPSK